MTERILIQPEGIYTGECDGSTFEIWGVLNGKAEIANQPMSAVSFILLPARIGPFKIRAPHGAVLLRTIAG